MLRFITSMAPHFALRLATYILIALHPAPFVFGYAEASTQYECANSGGTFTVAMETTCDGVQDCPMGDDEFFCDPCPSWSNGFFKSPCPNSDTCFWPSEQCGSISSCPGAGTLTDLCWQDKCPSRCICDVMSMYCNSRDHRNSSGTEIDSALKIVTISYFDEACLLNEASASSPGMLTLDGTSVARFSFRPSDTKFLMTLAIKHVKRLVMDVRAFESNSYLTSLHLIDAGLTSLYRGMFDGLVHLITLDLRWNHISVIGQGAFDDLYNLQELYLQGSRVMKIEPGVFMSQTNMQKIFLMDSYYDELGVGTFDGLESLGALHVADYRLCCLIGNLTECVNYQPGTFSCSGGLLQYTSLRVLLWCLGMSALIGNTIVIVVRALMCRYPARPKKRVHSILVANLAVADLLTGAYIIALVIADLVYGVDYLERSSEWRYSIGCKAIGFVIVVSREASLLILTLVALDRSLRIDSPRGACNLTPISVGVLAALTWLVSIGIGIVPLVLPIAVDDAASNFIYSDVCFGLPLLRSSLTHIRGNHFNANAVSVFDTFPAHPSLAHAQMFGMVVFLAVNLLLIIIIFLLFFVAFVHGCVAARKDDIRARRFERGQELRLALRMAVIVVFDFCCWTAVIIMGIMAQTGMVEYPDEIFTWCVVVVLPASAAINPWIYSIGSAYSVWKRKTDERPRSKYILQ